jgi:hypothetical protein
MTEEQQKVIYDSLTNKRLKNKKPIKLSRRTAPPATTDEVKPKVVQEVQINNYVKNIFNFSTIGNKLTKRLSLSIFSGFFTSIAKWSTTLEIEE